MIHDLMTVGERRELTSGCLTFRLILVFVPADERTERACRGPSPRLPGGSHFKRPMKLALGLMVGLLVGFMPLAHASPFPSRWDGFGPAENGLFLASIHSPVTPSLPRPSVREDLIETLASEEEEDDIPEAKVGGIATLLSLDHHRMPLLGPTSSPWRRVSGSLHQAQPSRLRC